MNKLVGLVRRGMQCLRIRFGRHRSPLLADSTDIKMFVLTRVLIRVVNSSGISVLMIYRERPDLLTQVPCPTRRVITKQGTGTGRKGRRE